MFCFCFLFLCLFFNDSCLSDYLKIYCRILKAGRTLAVGDQSEISFSIPRCTLPWQPILLVLSTELIVVTPAASGTAGRANAGHCRLHLVIGLWLPMQQDLLSVDMYLSHRVCLSPLLGWALLAYLLTCRLTCYL